MLRVLPDKLGERELTRQTDLARLVRLAAELDDGVLTGAGFAAELRRRFDPGGRAKQGVHLLTYHRAKGLEFDAVFLPRLDEKELPSKLARTPEELAEERRLLYVGHHACAALARPQLVEAAEPVPGRARAAGGAGAAGRAARGGRRPIPRCTRRSPPGGKTRAQSDEIPAYIVFHNSVLAAIADAQAAVAAGARPDPRGRPGEARPLRRDVLACCGRRAESSSASRSAGSRRMRSPSPGSRLASSSARGSVSGAQASLTDQLLVHAPEPAAVRRVDGHAERGRFAVHRPARGDDEVGVRDQALRVDRLLRDDHRRQRRASGRSRAARPCAGSRSRARCRAGRGAGASAGRAGSSAGGRARRRAAAGGRRASAPGRAASASSTVGSGSKSAR